jgi:hypothetical protein
MARDLFSHQIGGGVDMSALIKPLRSPVLVTHANLGMR